MEQEIVRLQRTVELLQKKITFTNMRYAQLLNRQVRTTAKERTRESSPVVVRAKNVRKKKNNKKKTTKGKRVLLNNERDDDDQLIEAAIQKARMEKSRYEKKKNMKQNICYGGQGC